MLIPPGWDMYIQEDRKERFHKRCVKAKQLSGRIEMFLNEIKKDKLLTDTQKEVIRQIVKS